MEDLKKYPFYPELTDEGKQQAQDLMMKAPPDVTMQQLKELHIQVKLPQDLNERV